MVMRLSLWFWGAGRETNLSFSAFHFDPNQNEKTAKRPSLLGGGEHPKLKYVPFALFSRMMENSKFKTFSSFRTQETFSRMIIAQVFRIEKGWSFTSFCMMKDKPLIHQFSAVSTARCLKAVFVFDDVGVVSTFRVPKTCCLPISTKRKKTHSNDSNVALFFGEFKFLIFSTVFCRPSFSSPFHVDPFHGPPQFHRRWPRRSCARKVAPGVESYCMDNFQIFLEHFQQKAPKITTQVGEYLCWSHSFLFFCWSGLALAMWCGVIWWRCVHFALSMFFFFWEQKWRDSVCKKMNLQVWPQQFVAISRWFTCCRLVGCLS